MEFIELSELSKSDKVQILELWNNEYPEKLAHKSLASFEAYLENLSERSHVLVIDENNSIKGWYFDFVRDNEKWFAIILDMALQGLGVGTRLLNRAKDKEVELSGWVIDHNTYRMKNGGLYESPLNFYLKNGFEEISETRLELNNISAVKIKWRKNKTDQS